MNTKTTQQSSFKQWRITRFKKLNYSVIVFLKCRHERFEWDSSLSRFHTKKHVSFFLERGDANLKFNFAKSLPINHSEIKHFFGRGPPFMALKKQIVATTTYNKDTILQRSCPHFNALSPARNGFLRFTSKWDICRPLGCHAWYKM